MNLSELKIETYSDQLSEKDLTEVKGGSTPACTKVLTDAALSLIGWLSGGSKEEETAPTDDGCNSESCEG